MSRECRKCGEYIPYYVNVDGKTHSLQNRKFCLTCSPFKKYNRSSQEPFYKKNDGKTYKTYDEDTKESIKCCLYKRALDRKAVLIENCGGGCKLCGYNKCNRSLSFHHRDPSTKIFGLTLNLLWSKSMEEILIEAEKCDLLCMNCHAEVEDAISRKTSIVQRVNEKYGTDF